MATVSTIPALKSALHTALVARPAFVSVQVEYGDPGDNRLAEAVILGATTTGDQETPALGPGKRRRQEDYVLHVEVDVHSQVTASESELRAFTLLAEIEDELATDTTVGAVANLLWAAVTGVDHDTFDDDESGRPRTVIELEITCRGNLK